MSQSVTDAHNHEEGIVRVKSARKTGCWIEDDFRNNKRETLRHCGERNQSSIVEKGLIHNGAGPSAIAGMLPPHFAKRSATKIFRNLSSFATSAIRMCFGDMVVDLGVSSCFRVEALVKHVMILIAVLAVAPAGAGQDADDYRGGWRTDSGEAHVYEFSIRGATVRGVYCTYCADATTLAFIDGTFGPEGITFEVTHVKVDGSTAYKDRLSRSSARAA